MIVLFGARDIVGKCLDILDSYSETFDLSQVVVVYDHEYPALRSDENLSDHSLFKSSKAMFKVFSHFRDWDHIAEWLDSCCGTKSILISCYFPKVIPFWFIEKFQIALNIHGGLLPAYRGALSSVWAVWNGERKFGSTLHLMDRGVDTGQIIRVESFDVFLPTTSYDLYLSCETSSVALFDWVLEHAELLTEKRVTLRHQSASIGRTYMRGHLPCDGIINLGDTYSQIDKLCRALYFPGFSGAILKSSVGDFSINTVELHSDEDAYVGRVWRGEDLLFMGCATGVMKTNEFEYVPPRP